MASFVYQVLKEALGEGGFSWAGGEGSLLLLLLDADTGSPPDPSAASLAGLVGELDTDNYARRPVGGRAVVRDDDAVEGPVVRWVNDDVTFPALGPAEDGPTVGGALLIFFVEEEDETHEVPLLYFDDVTGPTNGTDFTVSFPETGTLRFRDAAE